jgi:predicted ATPase/transcriptional regulator with XRE-family HTH domain/Tfp pilus assembly protein PilF
MTAIESNAFAALLRQFRVEAGLTQEELAERAGLSVRGISDLERGVNRAPYVATVTRLADALELADEQRAELDSCISRRRGPTAAPPVTQLPEQMTSLVGRERDVAAAVHLLRWEGRRLLTLTGPGGVGKTRLAIQVAATMASDFESGAAFVPLEEVSEIGGVSGAIAVAIKLRDRPGQALYDTLMQYLGDREMLLVLDGFEHLIKAAALPAELLAVCPRLKVLITSRAPLHLRGEQELEVKSLPVPNLDDPVDFETLRHCASVALFTQCAQRVQPGFDLTPGTAATIAEVCRRLEGLPLAIELAAARIKLLSPQALLVRLASRLRLLTGGPSDSKPRQQTMRNTISWSYDLLPEDAQLFFRSFSVFNGPFAIDAAAAVAGGSLIKTDEVEGGLAFLVDESLLSVSDTVSGEPHFSMLETVREYGLEQLEVHGETEAVRLLLAEYCASVAESAERELHGVDQAQWMTRLEREHATFLLALSWVRESGNLLLGFRIAGALWRFWYSRGYLTEGRRQLEGLLSAKRDVDSVPLDLVAKALRGAAVLTAVQGDYQRANALSTEGLTLYRQIEDGRGEAAMLVILGNTAYHMADYAAARRHYEESLALFRREDDEPSISVALNNLANIAKEEGRNTESIALYEESLAIKRRLGDSRGIAIVLNNLGTLALAQGAYERGAELGEEALELLRALGDKDVTAAVDTVARAALQLGDMGKATQLYREGLAVSGAAGDRELIAFCLEGAGRIAAAESHLERAGALFGAGDALRTAVHAPLSPAEQAQHEASVEAGRIALGPEKFALVWGRGAQMTLEEMIAFATENGDDE